MKFLLVLTVFAVALSGCGQADVLVQLEKDLRAEQEARQQEQIEYQRDIKELQKFAMDALASADKTVDQLVDEVNLLQNAKTAKPVVFQPQPVVRTVTRVEPEYIVDGTLDSIEEGKLMEELDRQEQAVQTANRRVKALRKQMAASKKALDDLIAKSDKPPIREYSVLGGLGALVLALGGFIGRFTRRW